MKRMLAILAMVMACDPPDNSTQLLDGMPADGPGDPFHAVVACDPSWQGKAADCEIACQARPPDHVPMYDNCKAENPNDEERLDYCETMIQNAFFVIGDRTRFLEREGCCVRDRKADRMVFRFCTPSEPGPAPEFP